MLIHTGPIGMYKNIEVKNKRDYTFAKVSICVFFAF